MTLVRSRTGKQVHFYSQSTKTKLKIIITKEKWSESFVPPYYVSTGAALHIAYKPKTETSQLSPILNTYTLRAHHFLGLFVPTKFNSAIYEQLYIYCMLRNKQ